MIIVDADATPDIQEIINLAIKYNIEVKLISDYSHQLNYEYASVHYLSTGNQNVDMYIINNLKSEDILITQDIALASLALSITKKVMNPKGLLYKEETIDQMLFVRHLNQITKFAHAKNKKRNQEDKKTMINTLEGLIKKSI